MSDKNNNPRKSLLLGASAIVAAAGLLGGQPASAQPAPAAAETADEEEEIVVVGSRIRRDTFSSTSPVQVIDREESIRAGLASTTEVLQSTAVTGGNGQINNLFGGFVIDGGPGVNTLGLRGFGPTATLILINGRRLSPAGTRGAVGAADLNTIPAALVDRIEILKDGASSIYGSDAVAGVVNIITNQSLDGFIFDAQRNLPEQSGGEQSRISLSGGHDFGNLSLTGSLEYYEREAIAVGDRDFTRCPNDLIRNPVTGASLDDIDPLTGQLKCFTINFGNSAGVTINTIGTAARPGFGGPGAAATGNFTRWRPNSFNGDGTPVGPPNRLDGFEGVNGGGITGVSNRDTFDPDMQDVELITPVATTNLFLSAEYDLGGNHELYGEFLYSARESRGVNFIQLTLDYPNNELLPAELRLGPPQNVNSTVANPPPSLPMPAPYATQVRAFTGFGNTLAIQDVDYTRYVAGIRGDLSFLQDWRYDFSVYYGRNEGQNAQQNFLTDRIFNSLVITADPLLVAAAPANLRRNVDNGTPGGVNVICSVTATNPAYGCIPAPALTTQLIGGTYPQDWVNWVRQTLVQTNTFDETAYSFIVDGPLFALPAGQVQAVFGLEHRSSEIDDTPEFNNINNNVYSFASAQVTRGTDAVSEAFVEVEFPILRDAPFADSLTLNLSGRYTDYDSYGSDSTYKVSGSWAPVESLLFRATLGTSYRAPALFEQFLGANTGFLAGNNDPCDDYGVGDPTLNLFINCDAEIGNLAFEQLNGITVFAGGGAATDISAETSENQTIGFTWRPLRDIDSWGDFSLAIDKFDIVLNDAVAQVGAGNIMNICYNSPDPASEPLCSLLSRDAAFRLTVNDNFTNIATQESHGWDYGARYVHSLMGGEVRIVANVTQYVEQPFQRLPGFAAVDVNSRIGSPDLSGDLAVNYNFQDWNFRWGMTWINNMDDYAANGEDPETSIFVLATPDYYLHDASVQYSSEDAWRLTLGVRNLFDVEPPSVSSVDPLINAYGHTALFSGFDVFGRQIFVNLKANF